MAHELTDLPDADGANISLRPPEPTRRKLIFDFTAGVILPVLCFAFDPIVFRPSLCLGPILGGLGTFTYIGGALCMTAFTLWLVAGRRLSRVLTYLAGIFLTASLAALALGLVLLPFSFIGLAALGLGALGFIPLLTAWVYWRNSRRAWRLARERRRSTSLAQHCAMAALAIVLTIGIPATAVRLIPQQPNQVSEACARANSD